MKIGAVLALVSWGYVDDLRGKDPKPGRPCINCGKLKQHNNAFCSAECCRDHKANSRKADAERNADS